MYPGATINHVEVTNGTSEANYILALTLLRAGDVVALQVPNYSSSGACRAASAPRSSASSSSAWSGTWEVDWDAFERAVTPKTRFVYITNPNNPTGGGALAQGDEADSRAH